MPAILPESEKARKVSVSLYRAHLEAAAPRIAANHRGQLSAYIQHLIERDLADTSPAASIEPDILARLCTTFAGYLAPRLRTQLAAHDLDQPGTVHAILTTLLEALERAPATPERTTSLHVAIRRMDLDHPEPGDLTLNEPPTDRRKRRPAATTHEPVGLRPDPIPVRRTA